MSDEYDERTIITTSDISESLLKGDHQGAPDLVVFYGRNIGERFAIDKPNFRIGRVPGCEVVLDGDGVSREHARIIREGKDYILEDLGSTNGTFLNDVKVSKETLKAGDQIKIGDVVLKFVLGATVESSFHEEVYRLTTVDGLTKAYNKRHFMEHLEREFERFNRYGGNAALVIYDIDHFKKVNDTYGHLAGDFVLQELSEVTKGCIRRNDFFARYGGEEFAIILPECLPDSALAVCEKLRKSVEAHPFQFEDQLIAVTISLGIAILNEGSEYSDLAEWIAKADHHLYEAKDGGRNQVRL